MTFPSSGRVQGQQNRCEVTVKKDTAAARAGGH